MGGIGSSMCVCVYGIAVAGRTDEILRDVGNFAVSLGMGRCIDDSCEKWHVWVWLAFSRFFYHYRLSPLKNRKFRF